MTDQLLCTYAIAAPNCKLVKYLNDFRDTTSYGLVTLVNSVKKVLNGPLHGIVQWHRLFIRVSPAIECLLQPPFSLAISIGNLTGSYLATTVVKYVPRCDIYRFATIWR
jgi:hypothetical protein